MIGSLRTRVRKQPIIVLNFESETVLKFYNLEARNNIVTHHLAMVAICDKCYENQLKNYLLEYYFYIKSYTPLRSLANTFPFDLGLSP